MSKVAKSALILVAFAIFSKGLGLAREMVLAGKNGTEMINDVFFIMFYSPSFLYEGLSAAIINGYIPIFQELKEKGREAVFRFNNNLITIFVMISGVYIGAVFLFPQFMTRILAWGYEGEAFSMAMGFARILSFSFLIFLISQVQQAFLQANERFVSTGLTGIPLNLFIIFGTLLSTQTRYYPLGISVLLGYGAWIIFYGIDARGLGYGYRPYLDLQDHNVKRLLWLIGPIFLGTAVNQLNMVIDRSWASFLPSGSVSYLSFAQRLTTFIYSIFVFSIATAAFPQLSADGSKGDYEAMKKTMRSSVNTISLLVIPICLMLMVLANPVIQLLFQRGAFSAKDSAATAGAMAFYAIGMVGLGYREILIRMFYALREERLPMISGVITILLNILLNYLLMGYASAGLALATSISMTVTTAGLFFRLRGKIGQLGARGMLMSFGKMMAAGILVSVLAYFLNISLNGVLGHSTKGIFLNLMITGGISMAVYLGILKLLKVEEISALIRILKRKKQS